MIIAYEMPAVSSFVVNQGSLVSDDSRDIYDGRPGTSIVMATPFLTSQTLRFTLTFAASIPTSTADFIVVKIDNVRSGWPNAPQVAVTLLGPGNTFVATAVVRNPVNQYASRSLLIPRSAFSPSFTSITGIRIDITNQLGNSQVSVGEVFVSRGYEVPVSKIGDVPVDPSQNRRSDGGQGWPLDRIMFRRVTAALTNVSYRDGFVDSTIWPVPGNLRNLIVGAARASKLCIITRWRYNEKLAADQKMIDANTMLCRQIEMTGFDGEAGKDRWPMQAVFEESL